MKKMLLALVTFISFSLSAMAGVNINTATQAELESLDGVGPVKAQAIIDYRKKNGGFKSVDELEKVNGVGPVTLQNVRKDISITGATTAVAKPTDKKPDAAKDTKSAKELDKTAPAAVKVDDKATEKAAKDAAKKAKADEKAAKKAEKDAAKAVPAAEVKAEKPAKTEDKAAKVADKEAAKKAKADAKAAKKAEKDAAKAEKAKSDKK
jgi:competence protein ComEA